MIESPLPVRLTPPPYWLSKCRNGEDTSVRLGLQGGRKRSVLGRGESRRRGRSEAPWSGGWTGGKYSHRQAARSGNARRRRFVEAREQGNWK